MTINVHPQYIPKIQTVPLEKHLTGEEKEVRTMNFIKRHRVNLIIVALNLPWMIKFAEQFYKVYILGGF